MPSSANWPLLKKAMFAKAQLVAGSERVTVQAALPVQKPHMTRLLQLVDTLPTSLARKNRCSAKSWIAVWMALCELLTKNSGDAKLAEAAQPYRFKSACSDQHFQIVFDRLSRHAQSTKLSSIVGNTG